MKVIPRRPYFPFLTDFLEYNQAANHTIPYTKRMIERYGDACDVSFLGIRNYFIHDPDVIREMLTSQNALMQRSYFFKAFRKFLGQGLFTADGDLHKQQRKLMKPAFYPERIREYARIMVGSAEEEIQNMKSGEVVNVNRAMTRITLKVITRSMFGSGLDEKQIDEIGDEITEVLHLINKILQNPVSNLLPHS
ncbi:MAG: cytochrome P450 [Bacteroidia bacterium]